jgi:hypothetical protein
VVLARVRRAVLETKRMTPLIVDKETRLLLDGHHRRTVAISLGIERVPVLMINYGDSGVRVEKWYRKVDNKGILHQLMRANSSKGKYCARLGKNVEMCGPSPYVLFWKLHWIERFLLTLGVRVIKVGEGGDVEPPSLSKKDVIRVARKGLVFPPKTTRHVYDFIIQHSPLSVA